MDDRWSLVLRVAASRQFTKAPQLHDMLLYICQRALTDPAASIKEHEIGCNALGRKADFNPNEDNIVRVQVSNLRKKLEEYFATDGKDEPMRITVPKGAYVPRFEPNVVAATPAAAPVNFPGFSFFGFPRACWRSPACTWWHYAPRRPTMPPRPPHRKLPPRSILVPGFRRRSASGGGGCRYLSGHASGLPPHGHFRGRLSQPSVPGRTPQQGDRRRFALRASAHCRAPVHQPGGYQYRNQAGGGEP